MKAWTLAMVSVVAHSSLPPQREGTRGNDFPGGTLKGAPHAERCQKVIVNILV